MKTGKKLLSVLLSLLLVLGTVALGGMTVSAEGDGIVWNAADNRYEISSYMGLKKFAGIVNGKENPDGLVNPQAACAIIMNRIDATASDPDLNPIYDADTHAWTPIGDSDHPYTGTFDGNGRRITGLTFNNSDSDYAGFFGYVGSKTEGGVTARGTVKNVCLEDGSITGEDYVGGVAGYNDGGTLENCCNTGDVSGDYAVGGVAGCNDGGTLENCYNTGTVSGYSNVGGVAGDKKGTVTKCYNTGAVSGNKFIGGLLGHNVEGTAESCFNTGNVTVENRNEYVGGLVGNFHSGTLQNCYNTGNVTAVDSGASIGGLIGHFYSGTLRNCYNTGFVSGRIGGYLGGVVGILDTGTVGNCYYDCSILDGYPAIGEKSGQGPDYTGGLPTGKMTAGTYTGGVVKDMPGFSSDYWLVREPDTFGTYYPHLKGLEYDITGAVADWHSRIPDGKGDTADNPYELTTYSQLRDFASIVNKINPSACARLMKDIDASSSAQANDWTPIGYDCYYTGAFDGNGRVITGLTFYNPVVGGAGLFGNVGEGGTVKNVGLEGGKITADCFVGGVVGYLYAGTVENCYNTGSVSGDYAGGVVGQSASGTVANCYNTGDVSGDHLIGGVVGYNTGTVTNCYNTGAVSGRSNVGGVVGKLDTGTVANCYYDKSVCGEIGAVNSSDSETVKGLSTAEMTGTAALDKMVFNYADGETSPWLVKENTCQNDFYPHLTGFAYDNDATDENWPPKTETGTGAHKYGEAGADRYTCSVCGQVNEELKAAELLALEKASAKLELNYYKNPDDYRDAEKAALAEAIAAGKDAIDNATDSEGVAAALADAKAEIDKIKTDARLTAEELDAAKTAAKQELDEYKNPGDYRDTEKAALAEAISDGKDAIDNAADTDGVASALADAKAEIDKIKTDAQLTAEELAANKEEYNRYKEQKLGEIDAMAQEGDSQQCSDIISGAKMLVAMLYYNENITLDENKSVIDAVISTLIDSLEEHRKVYHVLFVDENGATVYEVPYTIDTVSIDEPEVPAKEGYEGAWEEYKLTSEDITVKPVYEKIEEPAPENICKLDGEYHGDTFFGKLITFFHNLIWTAFSFIGLDIFFSIKRG